MNTRPTGCRLATAVVCLIATLACEAPQPNDHPVETIHFPIGVVADPAGDYLYVVNSNFDLAYAGGNVVPLSTRTHKLASDAAVQTPSFGGEIQSLSTDGQTGTLYVTTREHNSLTWIQVTRDPGTNQPVLSCSDAGDAACDGRYVIEAGGSGDDQGDDPFGVALRSASGDQSGHVFTGSFEGLLGIFQIATDGEPKFADNVELVRGVHTVAVHPLSGRVYATSKFANVLMNLDVSHSSESGGDSTVNVELGESLIVTNATSGQDFGRGLAFNADGSLAFMAYRAPPSLLVVDTSLNPNGLPQNRIVDAIPLGDGPANVLVVPSGLDGRELVYITLFNADQIAVFDPALMAVVEVIDVGDGPFSITHVNDGELFRAYVSLFEESAIAVIELDHNSLYYHQEIARIP